MRAGTAVALVAFLLLATFGRVWTLFDQGPYSADFYDEQAHSLVHGHVDVDDRVATLEGFHRGGKTYFYFGIVPAILHVPTALVTDGLDGRLVIVSMLAAMAVALLATGRLLWRARQWLLPDTPLTRRDTIAAGGFVAAVGISSPLLFLSARALVYHEAIAWGVAFTLVAFDLALEWWDRPTARTLLLASLATTAAMNSRSSVGLGAAVGLLLIVVGRLPRMRQRQLVGGACAVLAPFLLYGLVNVARFGDPVKIPWYTQGINNFDPHRVEMLDRNHGTTLGLQFVPTTFVDYVRPDGLRLQRLYPWITFRRSTRVIGDVEFDTIDRSSSVPTEAPALCLLGIAGLVALARRRRAAAPWVLLTASALVGVGPTLALGFIANRYLADFVPVLVVTAAIGLWTLRDRRVAFGAVAGVAVAGTVIVSALVIQSERLYLLPKDSDRRAFVEFQYDIDDTLFGGTPAGVERGDVLPATSRDQSVFIVGECSALFWGDGRSWFELERAGSSAGTPLCDQLLRRLDSSS